MITVYGASGHAKVVIDIIKSNQKKIAQILDDNEAITKVLGFLVEKPVAKTYRDVVIAIGDNKIRKAIVKQLDATYVKALIHNTSVIGSDVTVGNGTVIMANAIVNACAKIGAHCIINSGSIVEHDVVLRDFVHVSPGSIVTGGVTVGEGSQIGAGAIILPNLSIGKNVMIGAGAVVLKNVADNDVVAGNPARILKKNTNNE
ncbi:acetyltransferase [Dokdonia ponticola]|uniref:Acetyltransferase n=1 Tax=Dokdonia ponticola TaxID=2041041 RepID=A0ABV9HUW6_9FLAO